MICDFKACISHSHQVKLSCIFFTANADCDDIKWHLWCDQEIDKSTYFLCIMSHHRYRSCERSLWLRSLWQLLLCLSFAALDYLALSWVISPILDWQCIIVIDSKDRLCNRQGWQIIRVDWDHSTNIYIASLKCQMDNRLWDNSLVSDLSDIISPHPLSLLNSLKRICHDLLIFVFPILNTIWPGYVVTNYVVYIIADTYIAGHMTP